MASFKSLASEGKIKKGDKFRAHINDIHEEPGFNLRSEGSDLQEHIESMCASFMAGVSLPPMEVRVSDDGRLIVVDGHCRRRAILLAISRGAEVDYVDVLPFFGNDVDRVTKMIASSQGMALKPLERSLGYKRLINFGWDEEKIASHVGMTKVHVEQLLILANANNDVHQFVADGKIAAHTAIEIVRKHGEAAGAFILAQLEHATGKGKSRVTDGTIKGKALPRKVVSHVIDSVKFFASRISPDVSVVASRYRDMQPEELDGKTVEIDAASLVALMKAKEALDAVAAE